MLFYFWMFATMANLGLPALSGFVGEVTVFYGAFTSPMAKSALHGAFTQGWVVASGLAVVLTAGYMLWLLKRLFYGPEAEKWKGHLHDVTLTERFVAVSLSVLILIFGVYPLGLNNLYSKVGDRITASVVSRAQISQNPEASGRQPL
jgi:NADH:ubiquinone oxidoreductase subunit 4 (subunit M)